MRSTALLLLFLLLLLAVLAFPSAGAGASFTDPEGDVALEGASSPASLPPSPQVDSIDLLALDVLEEDNAFTFVLKVRSLQQPAIVLADYTIDMTWMDVTYRVVISRSQDEPTEEPLHRASLHQVNGARSSRLVDLDVAADGAAGTFSVLLPKVNIVSVEGHAPVYGSDLTGVRARSGMPVAASVRATDAMPDGEPGVIRYEKGGSANGHLVLESPDPVRVSNGGSATFVFQAHLQNGADFEDAATLTLDGVPETWRVSTIPLQKLPARDERPIFVVVTIPFGHEHGGFSNFTLVATSTTKPGIQAGLRFGVLHTPVPMPAGHHPSLFLHATSEHGRDAALRGTVNTLNTLPEREADEVEYASPELSPGGPIAWSIPLGPSLAMGLDADLNRTGELRGTLLGRTSRDATLAGEVVLVRGDEVLDTLFTVAPVALTLDVQQPTPFSTAASPMAGSDYVPYAPGQNILLRLRLEPATPGPCCPVSDLAPGLRTEDFQLTLPLNEYHDTPKWDPGVASTIALSPRGLVEREARPGTTVTYLFALTNEAPAADTVAVDLAGTHAAAASLAPASVIDLAPREERTLTLGVLVPRDAGEGNRIEVLLVARSETDPSNIAIGRATTLVKLAAGTQDERSILDEAQGPVKKTPLPDAWTAVALLAALALSTARWSQGRPRP